MFKDALNAVAADPRDDLPAGNSATETFRRPCVPPALDEHTTRHLRFATQAISDRHGRRVASELLFRWNSMDAPVTPALGAYATSTALSNALLDGQWLTRERLAEEDVGCLYVNMDAGCLMSPLAEVVTPAIGVIELLETALPTSALRQRVQELHGRGFRFSLDDVVSLDDPRWILAEQVETVKVDVMATPRSTVKAIVRMAHALGLRVIAEKVESEEDLLRLSALGVDLFQGYAVERPITHRVPALPGCQPRLVGKLYLLALGGASVEALAFLADCDPAVTARLLRLQALYAPQLRHVPQDLSQVMASIPPAALLGWLAHFNIAASHGRGQDKVARVRERMATFRASLIRTDYGDAQAYRCKVLTHYQALLAEQF